MKYTITLQRFDPMNNNWHELAKAESHDRKTIGRIHKVLREEFIDVEDPYDIIYNLSLDSFDDAT